MISLFFHPLHSGGRIDTPHKCLYAGCMETRRVLIVGDTLFAENLTQMLAQDATVQIAGSVSSLEEALPTLNSCPLDAVIVAGVDRLPEAALSQFLLVYPDVSILCTDLATNDVQVIVNQRLNVRSTGDLLAIIAKLPKRI